jgi:hypothetical protein
MKTFVALLISLLSLTVHAESHGGVDDSNARFNVAHQYAQDWGGTLYRVRSIQRVHNCYRLTFDNVDSDGKLSVSATMKIQVVGNTWEETLKVVENPKNCK